MEKFNYNKNIYFIKFIIFEYILQKITSHGR